MLSGGMFPKKGVGRADLDAALRQGLRTLHDLFGGGAEVNLPAAERARRARTLTPSQAKAVVRRRAPNKVARRQRKVNGRRS